MATEGLLITEEETNYIKSALLILRISTKAMREKFDVEFHPACLQNTLNRNIRKLNELKSQNRINQGQWMLLFPIKGNVTSKDFDITLMTCLMRNLTSIQIRNGLPHPSCTSCGDDLSRIIYYRNKIAHSNYGTISTSDFNVYWEDITGAITRLCGDIFKDECANLYEQEFNGQEREDINGSIRTQLRVAELEVSLSSVTEKLQALEVAHNDPVPKNVDEVFQFEIEDWQQEKFYVTSATDHLIDKVKDYPFVVITGSPGIGKSATSHYVSLHLQKSEGFRILPITGPENIRTYFHKDKKQLYVIDDMCGKFSAEQHLINVWAKMQNQIRRFMSESANFRILATCRLQVRNSVQFERLSHNLDLHECNLLDENLRYSREEKVKIASCYLTTETIEKLTLKCINSTNMFPLLCSLYEKSGRNQNIHLFENPYEVLEDELNELSLQNEGCMTGLALLVICNNHLERNLLEEQSDSSGFITYIHDIVEELGLSTRPSKLYISSSLEVIKSTYVKEKRGTFTAIHDTIFDILSLYFGKRLLQSILKHAHGSFIFERIQFESVEMEHDEFMIMISPKYESLYFERMKSEIRHGRFRNVFDNVQICNKLYQERFLDSLSGDEEIVSILLHSRWPIYISSANGCEVIVQFLINKCTSELFNSKDSLHGTSVKEIHNTFFTNKVNIELGFSSIEISDYPDDISDFDYSENSSYSDYNDDSSDSESDFEENIGEIDWSKKIKHPNAPLVAACEKGHFEIVSLLLGCGYDTCINYCSDECPTPLYFACENGHNTVVEILIKNGADANITNRFKQYSLHAATFGGHEETVRQLLKAGCNVDQADLEHTTAMKLACEEGHFNIAKLLLVHNSDCNISDRNKKCPLHIACERGHGDIVELLLNSGCNINACDDQNWTPLHYACLNGNFGNVKLLLEQKKCDIYITDNYHQNCLFTACIMGNSEIINTLLDYQININSLDIWKRTPLFYACQNAHTEVVQILINNNAQVDAIDVSGQTNLHAACVIPTNIQYYRNIVKKCDVERKHIVSMLLKTSCCLNIVDRNDQHALHLACNSGYQDAVEVLLNLSNCNVDQLDKWGKSPLLYACKNGYKKIVELLVSRHCNVNVVDNVGKPALHYACEFYDDFFTNDRDKLTREEIVELLIDNNCDTSIISTELDSAIHIACRNNHVKLLEILLRHDTRNKDLLCVKDNTDSSPLFIACQYGHKELFDFLISQKCVLTVSGPEGQNLLHGACRSGHVGIVDYLLNAKLDVNALDNHCRTPAMVACEFGHLDVIEILIQQNCNLHLLDASNCSVLHYACKKSTSDIVSPLLKRNCNINHCDKWKENPLFYASVHEHIECEKHLLQKDYVVHITDGDDQSILHCVYVNGKIDILNLILKRNCNVNHCDKWGQTPLHIASANGYLDVVKRLIEYESEVNKQDLSGRNALYAACIQECIDGDTSQMLMTFKRGLSQPINFYAVVDLLLKNKSDANIVDTSMQSALHAACQKNDANIVELLLKYDCDIHKKDKFQKTPLHYACEFGHKDNVSVLINHGSDAYVADENGETALDISRRKNFTEIASLLLSNCKYSDS